MDRQIGREMDAAAARLAIREQDEAVLARLCALLAEQGRRADAVADTLAPWLGRAWVRVWGANRNRSFGPNVYSGPLGRVEPEAVRLLEKAYQWAQAASSEAYACRFYGFLGWASVDWDHYGTFPHSFGSNYPSEHIAWRAARTLQEGGWFYRRDHVDDVVKGIHGHLKELSRRLRGYRPGGLHFVEPPPETHPPRHGKFTDGVLARLFTEDLTARIDAGRTLTASSAGGASAARSVPAWAKDTDDVLAGLEGAALGHHFTRLADACGNPLVTGDTLGRACMAIGLAYLEEVRDRVPDYAEASGQELPGPSVSMTFSGGTFYGGQFAGRIANIESTIAGVVQQGGHEVADALRALEQAVISQEGLDEEQRQDLLDNVGYLAEVAQAPPERRNRGIIRSALAALTVAASSGEELSRAMSAWGGVLHGLLP
ncbi:hypothetical protein [Streptomyces sp. NBC_00859]|uniref:hypothetical protein n=1 Tax=Streptomyces sp. NBC_00859 TaxID=2903682 RepID=UPI00386FE941|nr:hypothetical protein OG584_23380 [Streptomyces sp. NBC_00859]